MDNSRKICCGGFNIDDSLIINDKNTLATLIGGGVSLEPFYVKTIIGADDDEMIIDRESINITGIIGDLNLPEALINPKETITDVIVEYEVEYAGFKASKVELYQDEDEEVRYYSIGGINYGDYLEKGFLNFKNVPFVLVQTFDAFSGKQMSTKFVTHPDYLGHALVLRAKYYAVKPIGMSFTTAPNVLFSVPTMSTNAVVDCNVAPEYIHKILSNIEDPINPTHPYIPIFSLYDKTNKQMYNSSNWRKDRDSDKFNIYFNSAGMQIILSEGNIKLATNEG